MDSVDSQTKSKPNSWVNWKDRLVEFQQGRGKLSLLAELIGIDALEQGAVEAQKNRNAESAFVRRTAWGEKESANGDDVKGDDVAGHVLGDQTTNHYHPQPAKSSMLGTVASMALGAGLMAAGIPLGMALIGNGAKDAIKEVVAPAEKPVDRPAVNVGGLELRLGK